MAQLLVIQSLDPICAAHPKSALWYSQSVVGSLLSYHYINIQSVTCDDLHMTCMWCDGLVPRPHPSAREKGLVTIARFLVCAELSSLDFA